MIENWRKIKDNREQIPRLGKEDVIGNVDAGGFSGMELGSQNSGDLWQRLKEWKTEQWL